MMLQFLAGLFEWPTISAQPPIAREPGYDPGELRVFLSPRQLCRLPIKTITPDELYELMCDWHWNGIEYYPPQVEPLPAEVGYDLHARYVVA